MNAAERFLVECANEARARLRAAVSRAALDGSRGWREVDAAFDDLDWAVGLLQRGFTGRLGDKPCLKSGCNPDCGTDLIVVDGAGIDHQASARCLRGEKALRDRRRKRPIMDLVGGAFMADLLAHS